MTSANQGIAGADARASRGAPSRARSWTPRHWSLWRTPARPLTLILSVEALCLTVLALLATQIRLESADLGHFALLFAIAVLYASLGDRFDRIRRFLLTDKMGNAATLWCFAAALVLPVALAGIFTAAVYGHALLRAAPHKAARVHRLVYTASTEVLATIAAAGVIGVVASSFPHRPIAALAVVVAALAYLAVNQGLVAAVIHLSAPSAPLRSTVLGADEQLVEVATLVGGVFLGVTVLFAPWLSPLAVVLVITLRRSALVRDLQQQATVDAKTGLLNAGAWRLEAERELARAARAGRSVSLLIMDLDHFKRVNDTYGHQAGDATLKAVAGCMSEALRGYDLVGRYGGEEFVALLADVDTDTAQRIARRLCDRIRALPLAHGATVTTSVGVASARRGAALDVLIKAADGALYRAKDAGRDRVCAESVLPPMPVARSSCDLPAR